MQCENLSKKIFVIDIMSSFGTTSTYRPNTFLKPQIARIYKI